MASFGWSVGDVVAVGKLAWKLYNGCKNAGEDFRALTEEVRALQAVLQEVGDELTQPKSVFHKAGKSQRMQLANLMNDCNTDLRDLERFLLQHKSLNTSKPRYWDRIRFGAKSTEGIRQKLSRHTEGLNLFLTHVNTLSLSRIEQASESSTNILSDIVSKLDQLRQEVQTGQKDGSVLFNVESESNWMRLEKELVGQHITERDVVTNRKPIQDHVMKWLDDVRDDGTQKSSSRAASSPSSSDPKRSSSMLPWCPDNVPAITRGNKRKGGYDLLDPQEVAFLTSNAEEHEEERSGAAVRCESPTSFLSRSNTNTTSALSESSRLESDQATGYTTPDACEPYAMGDPSGQLPDQRALIDQLDAFLLEMGGAPSLKPTQTGSSSMSTATGLQAEEIVADNNTITVPDGSGHERCRRTITQALPLTFEEALFGCTKYEAIHDGRTIEIVVPAGAHQGSRIGFSGIGIDPDDTIQDLEFVVEWRPHHLYELDGEHLVYTLEITLLESLCGWTRTVPTLDGQEVRVERQDQVTPPSWSTVYPGYGMPRASRPGARSNLAVKVAIKYPERISHEQKKVFQTTFGGNAA